MKRVLITGITGFAGSHLAEYLLSQKEYKISGTFLFDKSLENVEKFRDRIRTLKVDLNDTEQVFKIIADIKPDLVFHLAALAESGDSFVSPAKTVMNNITLEINILEAIKKNKLLDAKILVVSSAEVYGLVKKEYLPIDEETPFMPTNPYAVSKLAQDYLGLQYFLSYGLKIVRVRPFNHIGPRQSANFALSSWSCQIAQIEKKKHEPILLVGSLEAYRDFTDVRDMVKAYVLAIERGKSGDVYNLGSGNSYKISDILDILLSKAKVKIRVETDKSLLRPADNPRLTCDSRKFRSLTGWKPQIPLDKTLEDTLDYWRKIV